MKTSGINNQINCYRNKTTNQNNSNFETKTNDKKQSIKKAIKNNNTRQSIKKAIKKEYNPKNMTAKELHDIGWKLKKNNKISEKQRGALTSLAIRPHIRKQVRKYSEEFSDINVFLTSNKENCKTAKINWIKEINAQAQRQKNANDIDGYQGYKEISSILNEFV